MIHARGPFRTPVALAVAVVMLGLTLGMPLLDLGRGPGRVDVVDPDAGGGWVDHDHGLCMLYGAAPWSPAGSTEPPPDLVVPDDAAPISGPTHAVAALLFRPQPRAPPVV